MNHGRITYGREEIFGLKSSNCIGYKIINQAIFDELKASSTNNSLSYKRTKRGCKAGQRHRRTKRATRSRLARAFWLKVPTQEEHQSMSPLKIASFLPKENQECFAI